MSAQHEMSGYVLSLIDACLAGIDSDTHFKRFYELEDEATWVSSSSLPLASFELAKPSSETLTERPRRMSYIAAVRVKASDDTQEHGVLLRGC